jgi:hypothetical protein
VVNDHDFVFRNFNIDGNIGMVTVGIIAVVLFGLLKVAEFFLYASIKTSNGENITIR